MHGGISPCSNVSTATCPPRWFTAHSGTSCPGQGICLCGDADEQRPARPGPIVTAIASGLSIPAAAEALGASSAPWLQVRNESDLGTTPP